MSLIAQNVAVVSADLRQPTSGSPLPIQSRTYSDSSLMGLPRETRNQIFQEMFKIDEPIFLNSPISITNNLSATDPNTSSIKQGIEFALPSQDNTTAITAVNAVARQFRHRAQVRSFIQVLLVCKTFYAEASDVLYRKNGFTFIDNGQSAVNAMEYLRGNTKGKISQFVIRLSEDDCKDVEQFKSIARYGLRYCTRLPLLKIELSFLPLLNAMKTDDLTLALWKTLYEMRYSFKKAEMLNMPQDPKEWGNKYGWIHDSLSPSGVHSMDTNLRLLEGMALRVKKTIRIEFVGEKLKD